MRSKLAFIIPCALIILLLTGILVYASIEKNIINDGNFAYSLNEDGQSYSVGLSKKAKNIGEELVIPSSFNGLPVTAIRAAGFASCNDFKKLVVPASIKVIEYEAFKECGGLEEVSFAESSVLDWIGNAAFRDCDSLKSIELPSGIEYVPYNLFYGCNKLESVGIPDGVEEISDGAFGFCVKLENAQIPSTVKSLGDNTFFNCHRLVSVNFGDGKTVSSLKKIGRNAFYGCFDLSEVTFPEKIKYIEVGAFAYCTSLELVSFTGSALKEIGASAFIGCNSLSGVDVSDIANWCSVSFRGNDYSNPIYLGQRLFHNGELVLRLEIPYGVKTISARAFKNATRIVSVTLPRDFDYEVGAIGTDAFRFCYKLAEIHNFSKMQVSNVAEELARFGYIAAYVQHVYYWEKLDHPGSGDYYPYGEAGAIYSEDEYKAYQTNIYKCGANNEFIFYKSGSDHYLLEYLGTDSDIVLPETDTPYGIFTGAFFGQNGIRSVVVPDCVDEIWHFAFYSSVDLKRIYIPESVVSMGDRLFGKTTDLDVYLEASDHIVGWKDSYKNAATRIDIKYSQRKEDLPWVMELINQ